MKKQRWVEVILIPSLVSVIPSLVVLFVFSLMLSYYALLLSFCCTYRTLYTSWKTIFLLTQSTIWRTSCPIHYSEYLNQFWERPRQHLCYSVSVPVYLVILCATYIKGIVTGMPTIPSSPLSSSSSSFFMWLNVI